MSEEKKNEACSVRHIRRVDLEESSNSYGGDESYTDTENKTALDIAEQGGEYYLVKSCSYYSHSYDQYESPMNSYSQRTELIICPIEESMCMWDKEKLLEYMGKDGTMRIVGRHDKASALSKDFVTRQVEKALKINADEIRIAREKAQGGCKPNAVYIAYNGEAEGIYIDDFTTNEGLARALDCDVVTVCYRENAPEIAFFYNARVVYGLPYNSLASSFFGRSLEGAVVTCARNEDGSCAPLTEHEVEHVVRLFKVKKYIMDKNK